MEKIKMTTPLVEMDGDEMTRVLWQQIKDELLLPYIDLKTEYYDLGLPEREKTRDQVTIDSAEATKKYGVAVKCATITPNAQRVEEYKLTEMWKSPNGTIRAILDGTVFRAPIMVKGISPVVKNWKKPITIARHAYGDIYRNVEYRVPGPGRAELVFTGDNGESFRETIHDFKGCGVIPGIRRFAELPEQFTLAISLHSAIQGTRNQLMPGVRKYTLLRLHEAIQLYVEKTGRRPTYEFAMIDGINDTNPEMQALVDFCAGTLCHVNLIQLNNIPDSPFRPSPIEKVESLQRRLTMHGVETTIRNSRGSDIDAACGQLKQRRFRAQ